MHPYQLLAQSSLPHQGEGHGVHEAQGSSAAIEQHGGRYHDSLEKNTPAMRPVSFKPNASARLISFPRLSRLHHRYDWEQAA